MNNGNGMAGGLRILLVDDEPDVRGSIAMLLEVDGHKVTQAQSGSEALALISTQDFDLLITDHRMGEMNGNQLATKVKALRPGLPIWMLTGFAPEPPGPNNPVDGIIHKPCSLADLRVATSRAQTQRNAGL